MSDLVAELKRRAQSLPPEKRARLAEELLASLDPQDADIDAAWDVEIRRRVQEVEDATVTSLPAQEAFDRVRLAIRR